MKITHFGHACVLIEPSGGGRVLLDPGAYSKGFESLTGLDAILVTHEHPDHLDLDRLPALLNANPSAMVIADAGAGVALTRISADHQVVADGDSATIGNTEVHVLGGQHALIHSELPNTGNNAYLIGGELLHPGDAFVHPPVPVRVLLLPAGGPWMKVGESIDYLRAVAPEVAVPIHQAGLADVHRQLHYQLFRTLAPARTALTVLDQGAAVSV